MMIKLKRLLMIHWQAYEIEVIDFDNITLLTGQTGVGKSTIIDALNVILLGEKKGAIFNKAANENSSRTLESYLYGKLGDDGESGFYYLRNGSFTSYLVAEFENEETQSSFCCGLVVDCGEDRKYQTQWFTRSSALPTDFFCDADTNFPCSIYELQLTNAQIGENEFFITDKEYRKAIRGLFGQIRDDYRRLLKQSVSFSPIKNIENFLTDFVSESETSLDVVHMQSTIRRYNDLEWESKQIKKKIEHLVDIKSELVRLHSEKINAQRQDFFIEQAKLDQIQKHEQELLQEVTKLKDVVITCENKLEDNRSNLKDLEEEKEKATKERDKLTVLRNKQLLENKLSYLEDNYQTTKIQVDRAKEILRTIDAFFSKVSEKNENNEGMIELLEIYQASNSVELDIIAINEAMGRILNYFNERKYTYNHQINHAKIVLRELDEDKKKMERGIKSVPHSIRSFQQKLEAKLKQRSTAAKVEFLSDVIDFKSGEDKWHKAVEAYLNHQRYYLILDPQYYNDALQFYKECQKQGEVSGIGIINLKKVTADRPHAKQNSLAEKIVTKNPLVKSYINYLLGRVIACENILELSEYSTAITPEGFLYQGYVTRKIKMAGLTMSIGNKALEQQLADVKKSLDNQNSTLKTLQQTIDQYERFDVYQKFDSSSCITVIEYSNGEKLTKIESDMKEITAQLSTLDQTELKIITQKINELTQMISHCNEEKGKINGKKEATQEKIDNLQQRVIPQCIVGISKQRFVLEEKFTSNTNVVAFKSSYDDVISAQEHQDYDNIAANYEARKAQTNINKQKLERSILEKMADYNTAFTANMPVNLEQKQVYLTELEKYSESELSKFEQSIKEAHHKATEEFQFDFLGKLKENIESLRRQVDEINASLKGRVFGEDTYRFEVKENATYKTYYDMIMDDMLMSQGEWNLISSTFETKYKEQIENLFNILAGKDVTSPETANQENRIQLYSDYKTYLDFDLIVKKGKVEQRLSKTYTDKSGGETQIPLYISLLAAFSQVYRVLNTKRNNTLRLIILDEAFSKIDGEKIRQCIQMIREFGLQAVFSTPPEKMSEIMEESDKALVVFREGDKAMVREFLMKDELPEVYRELPSRVAE